MSLILSVFEQGLIFGIMVLGLFITYRILNFPDMSVDGSFPLGAAITASALVHALNPFAACLLSMLGGAAAGAATGFLHVKLKISNLLSGILVMTALYSINLRIMGKANISLFDRISIFSGVLPPVVIIAVFALAVKILLDIFLKTKFGFLLTATGDNPQLVTSLGINTGVTKVVGLMVSNAFVALSGSLMAQYQNFSDIGMGTGTMVMGLASVILGQAIFKKVRWMHATTMALIGAVLYKASIAIALEVGLPPTDLKLITAVIVMAALALNQNGFGFRYKKLLLSGGVSTAANS